MATESSGLTPDTDVENRSGKSGIKITTNNACKVISITTEVGGTTPPDKVHILDAAQSVIASADIVGVTGTFSSPVSLANATDYFLTVDRSGNAYTLRKDASASSYYTHSGTNWDWIAGLNWDGNVLAIDPWTFAIVSAEIAEGTNAQINVDDSWKEVSDIKVNVDDSWKEVASAKVNVDDSWKTIF